MPFDVWEAFVRATHTFLGENDIRFFIPLVRKALARLVDVNGQNNQAVGFYGQLPHICNI
jgi:hypothetical protein